MENLKARRWPFVESPGELTARVKQYSQGPGGLLAGLRTALIEDPPTISKEYLDMASGLGYCRMANACQCGGDTPEVRATCQNWSK